jgi:proteic killer suppression protein
VDVILSERVKKQLKKTPEHIVKKLLAWIDSVEDRGLRQTQMIKSFHDEPLKGKKTGHRSIRLSKQWRAEYTIHNNKLKVEFILIEEVHPHAY